jgi:uncharacterized protein
MAAFNFTGIAPGVYVEEVEIPGLIAGVGTSTAAIIGPAKQGPINQPELITTPTQFQDTFGGHITAPRKFASHAVHGFFLNGGTKLYFVRVGTARRASLNLLDRSGSDRVALVVTARQEGAQGNDISVAVQDAQRATTEAVRAGTTLAGGGAPNNGTIAEVADASVFRVDDVVIFDDGSGTTEQATVASTDTVANTLTLKAPLANAYDSGDAVRIADLAAGRTSLRVEDSANIEPGSYVRIAQGEGAAEVSETAVVKSVLSDSGTSTHILTLEAGIANAYSMDPGDDAVTLQTLEFTLVVTHPTDGDETAVGLAMDPRHSRYFASAAAFTHVEVEAADPSPTSPPANIPVVLAASPLLEGANDDLAALGPGHFKAGIDTLERVADVNIVCVPDDTSLDVQGHVLSHCEDLNRFAILDPRPNAHPTKSDGIAAQRALLGSQRGFGALYYPRIIVADPGNGRMTMPPSGHIAGMFARTDQTKGVHKAPANEQLRGVLGLERKLNETEQGLLNEDSINVLRNVPGRGFLVWGARTLSTSTQWRYVNVRRLVTFVEQSLIAGTQGVVFQPNNLALWQQVKRIVNAFLTGVWRDGALFGATPDQAFRVKVDEELNPPASRALGRLIIEVVMFPTTPAEFILFRIIQEPGGPVTIEE